MKLFRMAGAMALAVACCMPAWAESGLLETLKDKSILSQDEYAALKAQQPVQSDTRNGLRLLSADGQYALQVGTLQQLDFAAYDDDDTDLSNGSTMRRSRISIGGFFLKDFQYRVEYEFSGSTNLTDAYVAYTAFKPLSVTVGQFKQPFGMEASSAAKATTFMERGLPFSFITTRAPGVMLGSAGSHWSAKGGVFGELVGNASSGDEGYGVVARATYAPLAAKGRVMHFGAGVTYRTPTQDNSTNTSGAKFSTVRFSGKPESSVLTQRFVDTGEIVDVDHYLMTNLEAAGQLGATSLQAEYQRVRVDRDGAPHLGFSGWYAQIACTLSGEVRPYAAANGVFNAITPKHDFGRDGWGAFEIAARISAIDLSDGPVAGGKERNLSAGLNWYLNPILRVSGNLVKVARLEGGPLDGETPTIFETRLQLVF